MPVKWTSDKDQMLLLKILETHDFKVDTARVASAWPDTFSDRPTPRAITERLVKIRADAKKNGAVPASTPVKATVSTVRTPTSSAKKATANGGTTKAAPNGRPIATVNASPTPKRKVEPAVKPEFVDAQDLADFPAHLASRPHYLHAIPSLDLTGGAAPVTPTKPMERMTMHSGSGSHFPATDGTDDDEPSPSKRPRRSVSRPVMYGDGDEDDAGATSTASEYQADEYDDDDVA